MQRGGRRLAQLSFETVGDGSQQAVVFKLNGFLNVESGSISVGSFPKLRAAIRPNGFSLVEGGIVRAGVNPGDEQGLAGLSLIHDQKVIAQLASTGRFIVTDPPKLDSANLALSDFGADFKSRLITPSEDTTRGKAKDGKN
jgi:hypothetical protein